MYNHIRSGIRNILTNKEVSAINILGIALSFAAVLLIITYVTHELNFDKFHHQNKNIYRVESKRYRNDELVDNWASTPVALGPELQKDITGISDFVRLTVQRPQTERIVSRNEIYYRETRVCYTEPSFFNIFSFELLEGEKESALSNPNSVVITEEMAFKYFGISNPIGELLTFSTEYGKSEYTISGILKDFPENSHFKFDFFVSWNTLPNWFKNNWRIYGVYTYLLTEHGIEPTHIIKDYTKIAENYPPTNSEQNSRLDLELHPISDIHFNAPKPYEIESKGNKANVLLLLSISIAILVIAWINYINLHLSLLYRKLKDYMMRKIAGACFKDLAFGFLGDVSVIYIVALPIAVALAFISLPFLNQLTGLNLTLRSAISPLFWRMCMLYMILVVIFSAIIPAYIINHKKAYEWINSKSKSVGSEKYRKLLVIAQFAASIVLMSGTLIVHKQLEFMRNQPLGYNTGQKLVICNPAHTSNYGQKLNTFKEEIKKIAGVKNVSSSGVIPGMEVANFLDFKRSDQMNEEAKYLEVYPIDQHFTNTYGINLIAGNNLPGKVNQARNKILLNEEAIKLFGFRSGEDALEKMLVFQNLPPKKIVGIVKNFHQQSLEKRLTPIAFVHNRTFGWLPPRYITIDLSTENIRESMKQIDSSWNKFFNASSYDYFFMDRYFNQQYKSNENFGIIFGVFTSLTIFIASLGLLGLALFAAQNRIKEIGIRKVNGARIAEILGMLNKDFVKWVLIAFIIAAPIAWYTMNKWLENFAYKTTLSWWIFALAGVLALGIALLTVSFQSYKAATRNPIESLRYE